VSRFPHGLLATLIGLVIGGVVLAAPAAAHTGATVEPAVAGATDATVTINAAAESNTAGITSLKIVLPQGIAPADVTYVDGPAGWALQPDSEGYVVSGPPAPVGRDVRHRVRVRQLPLVPVLVFKVLQTYTDGRIDRWIEVPSGANSRPENPAPVVRLSPPPGGFPSGAVSNVPTPASTDHGAAPSAAPTTAAPTTEPPTDTASGSDEGGDPLPWIIIGVVLLVILVTGSVLYARRVGSRSEGA
jgi:hypothetical protein